MLRFLAVLCLVLAIVAGIGIYGTFHYYGRFIVSQGLVSIYIDKCEQLGTGYAEARQLVQELGRRNKAIADAARAGLEFIDRKFKTEETIIAE